MAVYVYLKLFRIWILDMNERNELDLGFLFYNTLHQLAEQVGKWSKNYVEKSAFLFIDESVFIFWVKECVYM